MRKNNIVISVILFMLLFAGCIQSYAYDAFIDGIYYNLNSETLSAEVTWGENDYTNEIVIPSSFEYNGEGYVVTSIGENVFNSCSSLTSVTIPNSVTTIGYCAFYNCI